MFGLVLARPSPNKLICLLAVFCIRYEVETKSLFNYAGHTQQKLVTRWGVGEHVTMIKTSIYILHGICDPVEGMEGEEASLFEIRKRLCGLCLIGKIVPEHCTTIPKAALQKICVWPWKC